MKFLLALLMAFAMIINAYAAATEQVRVCCVSEDCSAVQCLETGCLPVASPVAVINTIGPVTRVLVRDVPAEVSAYLPNRYREIWTPPD